MPPSSTPTNSPPTVVQAAPQGGTITAGGMFQQALPPNPARKGGFLQNNSATNVMKVYCGTTAAANSAGDGAAIQVPAGKFFNLNLGIPGFVYQGALQVDGTTSDAFATLDVT